MESYTKLKQLIEEVESDIEKAAAGNKAATTRVRKVMQEVKAAAQDVRKAMMDIRNAAS